MGKIVLVMFMGGLLFSSAGFTKVKLGWVDVQKAIESTTSGKKLKRTLDAEAEKMKRSLRKKEKDLKKMSEDLKKKRSLLSAEILRQKQASFQEEMLKYRDLAQKSSLSLQKKQQELLVPVEKVMKKAIQRVAEKGKFDMIFQKGTPSFLLWAHDKHNLTSKVIKTYEAILKKSKKKK